MKTRAIIALGVFVILAGAAFAQRPEIRAQIDFPFTIENRTLPAGSYDFIRDDTALVFRVTDDRKNEAVVPIITRLAAKPGTSEGAYLVFDKIGDKDVLAEIWVPGEDGYAVSMTKAKHEHRLVKAK